MELYLYGKPNKDSMHMWINDIQLRKFFMRIITNSC